MEPTEVELSPWAQEKCRRSGIAPNTLREHRAMAVDLTEFDVYKLIAGPVRSDGRRFVFTCWPQDHIIHDFADQKAPPSFLHSPAW